MACDRAYNPDVYASVGQSAYAFATYYPYAGQDDFLCASSSGYSINDANIPYIYSNFIWQTSGSGMFSDSTALSTTYFPSDEDYDAGQVTLTLRVTSNGVTKTDALTLSLYKALQVFAGEDSYSGINRPLSLDQAETQYYDTLHWTSMGDGHFEDAAALHTLYYPGERDIEQGFVKLILEAWSLCGHSSDTVRFELFKDYALEGHTWSGGIMRPYTQVVAVALSDDNPFVSGFYRTTSDDGGFFRFDALLPDTYILYAFPDTLDAEAGGCYYLGDLQWNESNMIEVDGDVYDVDIDLPLMEPGFHTGNGLISGVFDYPDWTFKAHDFYCQPWLQEGSDVSYCSDGLSNVGMLLLNATKQRILGFALTGPEGHFSFNDLPFGTYYVMADLPRYGRGMCEEIILSPNQPLVEDLHLFITQEGRGSMRYQNNIQLPTDLEVYPNPAEETVVVRGLSSNTTYNVSVMNSLGIAILPETQMSSDLLGELPISVSKLSSGIYFIQVRGNKGTMMAKFVKR